MKFIKNLLGITLIQSKIKTLQSQTKTLQSIKTLITKPNKSKNLKNKTLIVLKSPTSTTSLAKQLKISRSYASAILNQLKKQNKIHEHSKHKKTLFYKST